MSFLSKELNMQIDRHWQNLKFIIQLVVLKYTQENKEVHVHLQKKQKTFRQTLRYKSPWQIKNEMTKLDVNPQLLIIMKIPTVWRPKLQFHDNNGKSLLKGSKVRFQWKVLKHLYLKKKYNTSHHSNRHSVVLFLSFFSI